MEVDQGWRINLLKGLMWCVTPDNEEHPVLNQILSHNGRYCSKNMPK